MNPTQNTGIYIHIPFCRSKCPYCDFYSLRTQEKADAYTDAVTDEIKTLRRLSAPRRRIPFISEAELRP